MKELLKKKKLDMIIIPNFKEIPPANFIYFAGVDVKGMIKITTSSKALLTFDMEMERAKKKGKLPVRKIKENLGLKGKRVGVDFKETSLAMKKFLKGARLVDVNKELSDLRASKKPDELKKIKKAIQISEDIFIKTFFNFKKFKTERDVAAFMEKATIDAGCTLAYPTIVASGSNASMPHYEPSATKLKKGFCVIDFGVKYQGYCSDITRTIFLGTPSKKDTERYFSVLSALHSAEEALKKKQTLAAPDIAARKALGQYEYLFTHALGHGFGLDIHEGFALHKKSKGKIPLRAVFTIEPGIYDPGKYGIRIEDDYVMTAKGAKKLTSLGQQLLIIK